MLRARNQLAVARFMQDHRGKAMRYHLNILHVDHSIEDEGGTDFSTLQDARNEAQLLLHELVAEALVFKPKWSIRGIQICSPQSQEVAVVLVDAAVIRLFGG
jgi:hypothetical protein